MIVTLHDWNDVGQFISEHSIHANILNNIIRTQDQFDVSFKDALSKGQLASKFWLADQVSDMFPNKAESYSVIICGGWYGTLSAILYTCMSKSTSITSVDINPLCESIANSVNAEQYVNGSFNAVTSDMYNLDYTGYDVVINTSCEHIKKFDKWFDMIPKGTIVILQSNNLKGADGHVNCISNVNELVDPSKISKMYLTATLRLPDYDRYMVVCMK